MFSDIFKHFNYITSPAWVSWGGSQFLSLLYFPRNDFARILISSAQEQSQWNTESGVLIIFISMVMFFTRTRTRTNFVSSHLASALWIVPRESCFFAIPLLRRHNNLTLACFTDEKNIKHCRGEFYVVCCALHFSLSPSFTPLCHAFATWTLRSITSFILWYEFFPRII